MENTYIYIYSILTNDSVDKWGKIILLPHL